MADRQTPTRRTFVKSAAYAGLTMPLIAPALVRAEPAANQINHASFGGGGMAWSDVNSLKSYKGWTLRAICDVDKGRLAGAAKQFPDAKVYTDYRELLDKEHKNLDSVNCGTPDHMHAPIGLAAMERGLHLYGQKPLAHDIAECRAMTLLARNNKLATQMGIQIHSSVYYRMAAALIQAGVIGKVKEVHTFSNKKWGGGKKTPDAAKPVPANLDWDLWIGVAPFTPFQNGIHPGNWRRFLDYGTGTFGDMGCHIYDPVYKALALTAPTKVTSKGVAPTKDGWSNEAEVHYVYPGTAYTDGDTVDVTWYDGNRRNQVPKHAVEALKGLKVPGQGSIFLGTKGAMLLPHIGGPQVVDRDLLKAIDKPKIGGLNHWHTWLDAVKGADNPSANFDYAGPMTEAILAGGIATRYPNETLEWDAANMKFTNKPDADQYVKRQYRKGWEAPGLA